MIQIGGTECARWLNMFPPKSGISEYYSPRLIMLGKQIDYNKYCKFEFGSYVQALNENSLSNTTNPRTIRYILYKQLRTNKEDFNF